MGRKVQGDDVRVAHFQQHLFLRMEVHELILFKDLLFAHNFECKDFIAATELDEFDPAEGAVTEGGENL